MRRRNAGVAPRKKVSPLVRQMAVRPQVASFNEVLAMIEDAKQRAYQAVNVELVGLYWRLGEYISKKIASAEWGDGVVDELAAAIARAHPGLRGFTRPNLFRMRQFYEAYRDIKKVSPLVRQLPWTHHLIILGQAKQREEREFYILAAIKGRWSKRELERQIRAQAFRRAVLEPAKVSTALRRLHPTATLDFKNAYSLEFLELSVGHAEADSTPRSCATSAASSPSSDAISASSAPSIRCKSASRTLPSTSSSSIVGSRAW